jgi:hypothetical protein
MSKVDRWIRMTTLLSAGRGESSAGLLGYATIMLGVCMLACIVPTHRALGLEPTVALRTDQLENIGRGAEIRASGLPAPKAEVKGGH